MWCLWRSVARSVKEWTPVSPLLGHGADVHTTNPRNQTPLWGVCDGGHLEVMQLLLERGATQDVSDGFVGFLIRYT